MSWLISVQSEGKRTTVAALHDARKRGERGARGVETNLSF
jgi:hypothetical protein